MMALPSLSELCAVCMPALLLLLLSALAVLLLLRQSAEQRLLALIPGPRPLPLLGNLLDLPRSQADALTVMGAWCRGSPGVIHTHIGPIHYVMVSSPEAAELLLTSRSELNKGRDYDPVRPWLGDGLLTSAGTKWHRRRKLITPAFHFAILDSFLSAMSEQAATLVSRLRAAAGRPQPVWPLVSDAALDVIAQTAMGVSVGAQAGRAAQYKAAIAQMGHIVHTRSLRPWLRSRWLFWLLGWQRMQDEALAVLHGFTRRVIRERRATRDDGEPAVAAGGRRPAFLDLLLSSADGATLSDRDVAEEVDTFMFEGHDTTTSAICWTLLHIARLPEVQRRLHAELDELLPDRDAPPSRDQLTRLGYLDCTIKESLRLCPPVPLLSRRLQAPLTMAGYVVPAGTDVMLLPSLIHRDPRHWPDPDTFEPERHLAERAASRHAFAFLPFSAGPRNCVGQRFALLELKAVLVAVLRHFRLQTSQEFSDDSMFVSLTLQSQPPIEISFLPRDDPSS